MNVTVFGSSTPKPGEADYLQAQRLGDLLAQAGHSMLTGGYMGTMEAASRGAKEAGGHVVGVTCDEIEAWRDAKHNPWVIEERRFATLRERLFALIDGCDAAMALPGGIGTLAEIAMMWSQMQIHAISAQTLILIGPGWQHTLDSFLHEMDAHVRGPHRSLLQYAADVDAAVRLLPKRE